MDLLHGGENIFAHVVQFLGTINEELFICESFLFILFYKLFDGTEEQEKRVKREKEERQLFQHQSECFQMQLFPTWGSGPPMDAKTC